MNKIKIDVMSQLAKSENKSCGGKLKELHAGMDKMSAKMRSENPELIDALSMSVAAGAYSKLAIAAAVTAEKMQGFSCSGSALSSSLEGLSRVCEHELQLATKTDLNFEPKPSGIPTNTKVTKQTKAALLRRLNEAFKG